MTTIELGSHTMLINRDARTVGIYSDSSASDRAAQRDWKAVCRQLRELGVTGLDESYADGCDVFAGRF